MSQKQITLIAHIAGWAFFFSLVLGFVTDMRGNVSVVEKFFSLHFIVFGFVYMFLFYCNTYFLIPKFYLQKKHLVYIASILVLLIAVSYSKPFDHLIHHGAKMENRPPPPPDMDDRQNPPDDRPQVDIVSIVLFFTVWSLSTAICIVREWRLTERRALQAETDKANAELSFLKAQINPHFLFNTLNNIYSLVVTKNEKAGEGIMKLSNIMRYVTDEVKEDMVSLESEINCIKDFIDLQKLRLNEKTVVELSINSSPGEKKIAPLLLMTFVENAFKYGASNHESSTIKITLTGTDQQIYFTCQNKIFSKKKDDRTGIGLQNARLRLQRLYPNKHRLNINSSENLFDVQLTLQV